MASIPSQTCAPYAANRDAETSPACKAASTASAASSPLRSANNTPDEKTGSRKLKASPARTSPSAAPNLIATPHIAGSTEEAQEIVGIRIVEQMAEYLNNGIAINAVNMPAITPEQYRAIGP